MQSQIQNVLQYLFFPQLGALGVACSQEKHSSVHCNCVDGCCRMCHLQTDSCSKHMETWNCCHCLSDRLGCSFSHWLSSLAASEGGSLGQGGSPFGCRAGVGAEVGAGEAVASSTCTGSAAGGSQGLAARKKIQLQRYLPRPVWRQEPTGFRKSRGRFCLCWSLREHGHAGARASVRLSDALNVVSLSLGWLELTTSASCSLVHESQSAALHREVREKRQTLFWRVCFLQCFKQACAEVWIIYWKYPSEAMTWKNK